MPATLDDTDSMRRIRYSVAASLDGFIADVDGGYGWIPEESEIDFPRYVAKIDTLLMGRSTWEITQQSPEAGALLEGMDVYVVSTTLDPDSVRDATVITDDVENTVRALRNREGKDIWLFGGGVLFRSMLEAGLVDRVEVGVVPVLLGDGIPLLPGGDGPWTLALHSAETFPSGIALLKYDVLPVSRSPAR